MSKKYMAYVGSYSYTGAAKGITVYDVDVQAGKFTIRCEVEVDNSSYVKASHSKKTLYSIADEGVVAFRIHEDGNISRLNSLNIRGMRGCHISTDADDEYLFVSGYHDGKITVISLNPDGSLNRIVDGIYHKGLGSIAERNFRPHCSCTKRTPDGRFVLAVDLGLDQVKIYRFGNGENKLSLCDMIPCDINSAPRYFAFSRDGKFIYLLHEISNVIDVYTYETGEHSPKIEKIQTISRTGSSKPSELTAATSLAFTSDEKYLFCANAGDNSVCVYDRDSESGLLNYRFCLPISGDYPKDIALFPDDQHLVCVNHSSNTLTFFKVDYDNNILMMSSNSLHVNQPNCCAIVEV